MTIQEYEELYKEALQEKGEIPSIMAQKMMDELNPKQLAKMALSEPKSLHYSPAGNELSVHEAIRDYFYEYLKEMGEYITDPYLKVDVEETYPEEK